MRTIQVTEIPNLDNAVKAYSEFMQELKIPLTADSKDTARRVAKMFQHEFTKGLRPIDFKFTTFLAPSNEMIVMQDIDFVSICAHHHLPFIGKAAVGYIPQKCKGGYKIVGLSKLARLVEYCAAKPSTQEILTNEIADFLKKHLKPFGCGIILRARHLCMEVRGVKKVGAFTITSALRGKFLDQSVRQEFQGLIK